MRRITILFLIMMSVAPAIPPIKEGGVNMSVNTVRNSTAISTDYTTTLAVNQGRTEKVLLSQPLTKIRDIAYAPLATDTTRGVALFGDLCPNANNIYTSSDGVTFTKIADKTAGAFLTYRTAVGVSISLFSVAVLDNGDYLLSAGTGVEWDGNAAHPAGRLFRSTDGGTIWTAVLDTLHGYLLTFGWGGIDGANVAIGEYGYNAAGTATYSPSRIYVSTDYGATWGTIPAYDDGFSATKHIHCVVFDPTKTDHSKIYVAQGDGTGLSEIYSISKAAGVWTRDAFSTKTAAATYGQWTSGITIGNYIYWVSDDVSVPPVMRHDPSDDTFYVGENYARLWSPPPLGTTPGLFHIERTSGSSFFDIEKLGSLYFSGGQQRDATVIDRNGLFFSQDGNLWSCLSRKSTTTVTHGFRYFARAGNNLFATTYTNTAETVGAQYNFPQTKIVNAEYVFPAITNLCTNNDFETNTTSWTAANTGETSFAIASSTDYALHGSKSMKCTLVADGTGGTATIDGPTIQVAGGYKPVAGDYITARAFIKNGTCPKQVKFKAINTYNGSGTAQNSTAIGSSIGIISNDWNLITCTFKAIGDWTGKDWHLQILADDPTTDPIAAGDYIFYVDCVEYIVSTSRVYDLKGFDAGITDAEYKSSILNKLSDKWSVSFVWFPRYAANNRKNGNTAIAYIKGAGATYLDLYLSYHTNVNSSDRFTMNDGTTATGWQYKGTHTGEDGSSTTLVDSNANWTPDSLINSVVSNVTEESVFITIADNDATTVTTDNLGGKHWHNGNTYHIAFVYQPFYLDQVNVCLVGDSSGTKIYIQDPRWGFRWVGDGTTNPLSSPSELRLGYNDNAGAPVYGRGAFANVRIFDRKLTQAEVVEVFNSIDPMIYSHSLGSSYGNSLGSPNGNSLGSSNGNSLGPNY